MENNKNYLRHFGLLFLLFAITSALVVWQIYDQRPDSYDQFSFFTIIVEYLPGIITLAAVGFAMELRVQALSAILISVALRTALYLLRPGSGQDSESGSSPGLLFWLNQLTFLLPYILFLVLSKPNRKQVPLMLAGIFLLYGDNNIYFAGQGLERIFNAFDSGWKVPFYVPYFFAYLAGFVVHFIMLCELVNAGRGKTGGYRPRLLNPGNEYSMLSGTLLFWSIKLFIVLTVIGCSFMLENLLRHLRGSEYDYLQNLKFLKWYYLLTVLATVPLLLCTAWYLRKFLVEYFMNWQHTSRLLYWLLILPGIGLFAWLVMLTFGERNRSFEERKKTLGEFAGSTKNGIIAVFSILLGLRLLLTLASGPSASILTVIISAALFFAMVSSRGGYYFNFYLNLAALVAILVYVVTGNESGDGIMMVLYPLVLFNLVQVVLFFPALHIEAFEYRDSGEEKPWQPGDDLF